MLFKDIPGYDDIKSKLLNTAHKDSVAHALMFSGTDGTPNLPLAVAFSTYLNCENPLENDACGECPSCLKALKYIHPDIHFVFPVSATKSVKSDDATSKAFLKEWRKFLEEDPFGGISDWVNYYGGEERKPIIPVRQSRDVVKDLSLKTFEGKHKIMVIWLPEYMNISSANALLKIIEEPPSKTHFLIVTNNEEVIISTIISRTQRVSVRKWENQELIKVFDEDQENQDLLNKMVHLADGNYLTLRSLMQDTEEDAHEWFRNWMRLCYSNNFDELSGFSDDFGKFGRNMRLAILNYGLHILREMLIHNLADDLRRVSDEESAFVSKFSQLFDLDMIKEMQSILGESIYHLDRNANAKIEFLALSLKIAGILKAKRIRNAN